MAEPSGRVGRTGVAPTVVGHAAQPESGGAARGRSCCEYCSIPPGSRDRACRAVLRAIGLLPHGPTLALQVSSSGQFVEHPAGNALVHDELPGFRFSAMRHLAFTLWDAGRVRTSRQLRPAAPQRLLLSYLPHSWSLLVAECASAKDNAGVALFCRLLHS